MIFFVIPQNSFMNNVQDKGCNISKILRIRNVKFLRYFIYMDTNIQGNSQVCISVPFTVLFVRNGSPNDKDFKLSQQKGIAILLLPKIKQNEN